MLLQWVLLLFESFLLVESAGGGYNNNNANWLNRINSYLCAGYSLSYTYGNNNGNRGNRYGRSPQSYGYAYNYYNLPAPRPGCCWYWTVGAQTQWWQNCPKAATEAPAAVEATEAPTEAPEEQCPTTYCYDVPNDIQRVVVAENNYTSMDVIIPGMEGLTRYGPALCTASDANCTFTWNQEITSETGLQLRWYFGPGAKEPDQMPNICDVVNEPPGSLAYNALKLFLEITTGGVTGCPIPTGTIELQRKNIPFKFQTDEKILCGDRMGFRVSLFKLNEKDKRNNIMVADLTATYALPEGDNCITMAEAQEEFKRNQAAKKG